jgi:hypothetical protein
MGFYDRKGVSNLPETLAPFMLQVRGRNLNNREMYQFLQFYRLLKKIIHFFKKHDVMQVY